MLGTPAMMAALPALGSILLSLSQSVSAAPAPVYVPERMKVEVIEAEKRDDSGNPPLLGSKKLLGYSPDNTVTDEDTDNIEYTLAPGQKEDADLGVILDLTDVENPQPIRGTKGGNDPGPQNKELSAMVPDKLAPPGTDHGQTINAQWPMALSKSKLGLDGAGWSRQENTVVMPDATKMAGVDMRLEPGAYRELHWHIAGEWALMLNGSVRVQTVNEDGQTFVDDVGKGDVWFFPPGIPHSLQALEGGAEFMLVFDDGDFSEDNTFLASEMFAHHPLEVLAKNFAVPVDAFDDIPDGELFIFPGTKAPEDISEQNVTGPAGFTPKKTQYTFHWSEQDPHEVQGGSVKIVDPQTFPVAPMFSAALVTVKPGAMREIHWHPSSDEWTFFISGQARGTLFTPPETATTFDWRAGDVAYFPISNSHYIENTGDEDLVYLEVLQADHFSDMSLGQWLAETPKQIVQDTLNLSDKTLAQLKKEKMYVVQGEVPQKK